MENARIRLIRTSSDAETWDGFLGQCGGTFRGLYGALRLYQYDSHLIFYLERYDVHIDNLKIGQFAISVGRKYKILDDGLALLPSFKELWPEVFRHILIAFGSGIYRYGNEWSMETARDADLVQLPGVVVLQSKKINVHAVDFAQWQGWEEYFGALSLNVRRNVKKARHLYSFDSIVVQKGLTALKGILQLAITRKNMFRRKGIEKAALRIVLRSLLRFLATRKYTFFAQLRYDKRFAAGFTGIEVGSNTFYLESVYHIKPQGAGWLLMVAMLERARINGGAEGRFVMGPDDGTSTDKAWRGVQNQRLQCRTTSFQTSIVTFSFRKPELSRSHKGETWAPDPPSIVGSASPPAKHLSKSS